MVAPLLLVLLDLSAAFDTIDHIILLDRLKNYVGIIVIALAWFNLYLSDHYQFVAVNEEVYQSIQYGVPQSSVLGPPLVFTPCTEDEVCEYILYVSKDFPLIWRSRLKAVASGKQDGMCKFGSFRGHPGCLCMHLSLGQISICRHPLI